MSTSCMMRGSGQSVASTSAASGPGHTILHGRGRCTHMRPESKACLFHPHSSMPARPRITCASESRQGGGLLAGLGKLFQGNGTSDVDKPEKQAPLERTAPAEVFMMANTNEQPEYPPFQVVSRAQDYVLRFYDVYPVVEMEYEQRQEGYAALGSFIDGENAEGVRFAYTQPVTMKYTNNGTGPKVMQMFLGSRRGSDKASVSVASLPAPTDPAVQVTIAGGELVAVSQFEGYITPTTAEAARRQLLAALKRDGVKLSEESAAGGFRVGQYGAVYQLAGRINEMYIKVAL